MVVFDLDDTLYYEHDYVRSGHRAVAKYLQDRNIDANIEGKWTDDMLNIYRNHKPDIKLKEDSLSALSWLKEKGIKIGIITDGRSTSQRYKINALGLDKLVEVDNIIISEEIGCDKTTDGPFKEIMLRNPAETQFVYIADNPAKDFHHPNLLGWQTAMIRDKEGKHVHPQALPADTTYHPKTIIDNIYTYLTKLYENA